MSVIGSNILAGASGQGGVYNLTKSLRFRSSASAYLNRTPASAATSRRIMTYSVWAKIGTLGTQRLLYEGYTSVSDFEGLIFNTSDQLEWTAQVNGGTSYGVKTPAVFRDPSAWYHIVCAVDTTQATSTNRVRIYVNGVEQTGLTTFYSGFPAQNTDLEWNNQSSTQVIGWGGHFGYYDGYMAEINMVDGQQLTPSSFGETSTTTGVWIPKKFSGTYGTNGFYLKFTDTTSTSTLGTDFSGNSNTWTVNNISLTAGVTYDSMTDVPTLTDATTANYCVINPLSIGSSVTIANGNLTFTNSASDHRMIIGSMAVSSGKWYAEFAATSLGGTYPQIGIVDITQWSADSQTGAKSRGWGYLADGRIFNNNSAIDTGEDTYTTGDVIGVAIDLTNNKVYFSKNGAFINSADPGAGTNGYSITAGYDYAFSMSSYDAGTDPVYNLNFGQRPFFSTPPTGFVALNTFNISAGTITTSGSFTGNTATDGPFIYLNGVPTAMTINGNSVTFGTDADKLSNGFKVRSSSSSYNASGSNTYSISTTSDKFKFANAQPNP